MEKERAEEKAPLVKMGQELAQLKIENMQKDTIIQTLGQELAKVKIELMQLKGGE
nr:XkdW family protein [Aneurinibacillus migulanus]